jgi:hypothetical protein
MHETNIIQLLWDTGHFRNPDCPTDVQESDLKDLTLFSDPVKQAVKSYQIFFKDQYQGFGKLTLNKDVKIDGVVGPATLALFGMERCGVPDFGVELTGAGSWPSGCHQEFPNNHAVIVSVDKRRMPRFLNDHFENIWDRVVAAYADIGMALIRKDGIGRPNISFYWTTIRGSTIGLAIVPNRPGCSSSIWCKYDISYNPSDTFNQWARLIAHEIGHNMSLRHTRGGIMNPSILRGDFGPTSWRGDPSYNILARYFGGEPIDSPSPPSPPSPPPSPPSPPSPPPTDKLVIHIKNASVSDIVINNKQLSDYVSLD